MDEDATLRALFVKLGFPGLLKFRAAAEKAGLNAPLRTLKRIVAESSQRQVLAKEPKYGGKIVADAMHGRWAADLISYVAQPAAGGFTHVLVVQDIFSRKIWTRALKSAQTAENTAAFLTILREARDDADDVDPLVDDTGRKVPFELNTDKGSEFTGNEFQTMLANEAIKFRQKEGLNDLSTIDRAIQTVKASITKLEITPGAGDWADVLQKATDAHNQNTHTHLQGGAPADVEGDKEKQFELQGQAARDRDKQTNVTKKMVKDIVRNPTYRTVTTSALKGLKERDPSSHASKQEYRRLTESKADMSSTQLARRAC